MKKLYKNGKQVARPKQVAIKGFYVYNPSDKMLEEAGYKIKEEEEIPHVVTNDEIKAERQRAYRATADQYLIAYQAYTELGEHEKAAEMKTLWIEERQKIDQMYPYIEE